MTSREFIERQFGNADGKSRSLSSVYKDGNGQIYSYYHHYPLLFQVAGLTFRNVRGYSSTTGKHIGWAGRSGAIDVVLSGCNQYSWNNPENVNKAPAILYHMVAYGADDASNYKAEERLLVAIERDLVAMKHDLEEQRAGKRRKDTAVYKWLEANYLAVLDGLKKVDNAKERLR